MASFSEEEALGESTCLFSLLLHYHSKRVFYENDTLCFNRGAAHVGMIKSMLEANIPIDMIGGTSIGSFMGALWAEEMNYDSFYERSREWSKKMTYYGRQIVDLTYPVTSMFTGKAFNTAIEEVFGNRQIEDLWVRTGRLDTHSSAQISTLRQKRSVPCLAKFLTVCVSVAVTLRYGRVWLRYSTVKITVATDTETVCYATDVKSIFVHNS